MPSRSALVVPIALLAGVIAWTRPALADDAGSAAAQAEELARQGDAHAREGNDLVAMRRFMDAIRLDAACGHAYLSLAKARERAGDWREAERTYDTAIEHIPRATDVLRGRADLLHRLDRRDEALRDLERLAHLDHDPATMRELGEGYIASSAWPAALAVFRLLADEAERSGDARALDDARKKARALAVLAGEFDPVRGGARDRGWIRRALAHVAKRRG